MKMLSDVFLLYIHLFQLVHHEVDVPTLFPDLSFLVQMCAPLGEFPSHRLLPGYQHSREGCRHFQEEQIPDPLAVVPLRPAVA